MPVASTKPFTPAPIPVYPPGRREARAAVFMDLGTKVALVTGGGHRLGRAISLALADRGAQVVVHYHTAAGAARDTAAQCAERLAKLGSAPSQSRPSSVTVQADLTRPREADRLFADLEQTMGRLDLLVHCVGLHEKTPVTLPPGALDAAFHEQLAINLGAAASTIRRAVPLMKRSGSGAVVTLSDALLRRPFKGYGPYNAAKSALEALTHTWAVELAPSIRVNTLAPGIILPAERDSAESLARWVRSIPLGRLGSPEELAEAACFLLQADYITGQVLAVDGGLSWAR